MNKAFLITYDLKSQGRDYTPLQEAIKRSPKWLKPLDSTWLVVTSETSQQIWNRLAAHITQPDRLLIIEVSSSCFGWLPKESWEWIAANFPNRSVTT